MPLLLAVDVAGDDFGVLLEDEYSIGLSVSRVLLLLLEVGSWPPPVTPTATTAAIEDASPPAVPPNRLFRLVAISREPVLGLV